MSSIECYYICDSPYIERVCIYLYIVYKSSIKASLMLL